LHFFDRDIGVIRDGDGGLFLQLAYTILEPFPKLTLAFFFFGFLFFAGVDITSTSESFAEIALDSSAEAGGVFLGL
jgi:hypothetical protein